MATAREPEKTNSQKVQLRRQPRAHSTVAEKKPGDKNVWKLGKGKKNTGISKNNLLRGKKQN